LNFYMLSSAKWVVSSFPSIARLGIQWNSFTFISSLFSHEKMFFPEKESPGSFSLPLLKT
jgi:hypothetical protein